MRASWSVLTAAAYLLGCSGSSHSRQQKLETAISRDEQRAAALRAETLRLQRTLQIQRHCIAISRCQAQREAYTAALSTTVAECNRQAANWEACNASRTSKTATGAGAGCLFGWVAAAVTGGAAAPAVLVGCGGGALAGHSSAAGPCVGTTRPVDCGSRGPEFQSVALQRIGLSALPPPCEQLPSICSQLDSLVY